MRGLSEKLMIFKEYTILVSMFALNFLPMKKTMEIRICVCDFEFNDKIHLLKICLFSSYI